MRTKKIRIWTLSRSASNGAVEDKSKGFWFESIWVKNLKDLLKIFSVFITVKKQQKSLKIILGIV